MVKKKGIYFSVITMLLLLGALILVIVLLAFPLQQKTVYDDNILFVLDLSYSMNAEDVKQIVDNRLQIAENTKISRLEAAKEIIKQIVQVGEEANYGLLVFSQVAHQLVPLTPDTGTFLDYLKEVNTGLLPGGGTDRNALEKIFSGHTADYTKIIFISDAENPVMNKKIFDQARKYLIGIGSAAGGNPTLPNGTVLKKSGGDKVISSFDIRTAKVIAKNLDATLFPIDTMDKVDTVVDEIVHSSRNFSYNQIQIFFVFLGVFILLLL